VTLIVSLNKSSIRESIAVCNAAGLETAKKPLRTLLGCAVGKRIGADLSSRHTLQPIVANRCCRRQTLVNIAGF